MSYYLLIVSFFSLFFVSTSAVGDVVYKVEDEIRNSVWGIGVGGNKYRLRSEEDNDLEGVNTVVKVSKGYIFDRGYVMFGLDIFSGPFNTEHRSEVSLDYKGTGFFTTFGYAVDKVNIRSHKGNYGFALGLSYSDIVGRSLKQGVVESDGENISKFSMRVTNLSLYPSAFFIWLKKGRNHSNRPQDLNTRIEGYLISIGVSVPLLANYRAKYNRINEPTSDGDEEITSVSVRGKLRGHSLMIAFTALIGL